MKRPGMTLPETLITLVILGIVTVVISTAYVTTVRIVSQEQSKSTVVLGSGRVLGPLDELLSQGTAVEDQYPLSGAATVTTSTNALVFTVPSIDPVTGELSTSAVDIVTVTVDSTIANNHRLLMTVYPDAGLPSDRPAETVLIATNVVDVYFRYPTVDPTAATSVGTTLRLAKTQNAQTATQTLALNTTLRNHIQP